MMPSTIMTAIKAINNDYDQLLFTRVAAKLAGKSVTVKFQNDLDDSINGYTVKENGKLVIYVDPDLDQEQMFATFLHEVAHCKLHADSITDNQEAVPAKALQAGAVIRALRVAASKRREYEAINLSTYWRVLAGNGPVRERLIKLLG